MEEEGLISYVIGGLNPTFYPFITSYSFATQDTALTFEEFQNKMLDYEMFLSNHHTSSDQDVGGFAPHSQKPK